MRNAFQKTDAGASAHEHVYRGLRSRIMHGQVSPGTPLTLRGVGQEFGVSELNFPTRTIPYVLY